MLALLIICSFVPVYSSRQLLSNDCPSRQCIPHSQCPLAYRLNALCSSQDDSCCDTPVPPPACASSRGCSRKRGTCRMQDDCVSYRYVPNWCPGDDCGCCLDGCNHKDRKSICGRTGGRCLERECIDGREVEVVGGCKRGKCNCCTKCKRLATCTDQNGFCTLDKECPDGHTEIPEGCCGHGHCKCCRKDKVVAPVPEVLCYHSKKVKRDAPLDNTECTAILQGDSCILECYVPPGVSQMIECTGFCTFGDVVFAEGQMMTAYNVCYLMICRNGKWVPTTHIISRCTTCQVQDASHVITFDGMKFDLKAPCNYTLVQRTKSGTYYPRAAIYAEFVECTFPGLACIQAITYKDSYNTAFTFYVNDLTRVKVNGVQHMVTSTVESYYEATVFIWKHNSCIRVIGYKGLSFEVCRHEIKILAVTYVIEDLEGICGYFDLNQANDLHHRDGTTYDPIITPYAPVWSAFADSWHGSEDLQCPESVINIACTDQELPLARTSCYQVLSAVRNVNETSEIFSNALETCIIDVCAIYRSNMDENPWIQTHAEILEHEIDSHDHIIVDPCNYPPYKR